MERMNMSARAYDRNLKVAHTIADLEASIVQSETELLICCALALHTS